MTNSPDEDGFSADRSATVARYTRAMESAMSAQQAFVHSSLVSEAGYFHGLTRTETGQYGLTYNRQWGLHAEADALAVAEWVRIGAPLDGLWKIHYGDDLEHWETPLLTALVDERVAVAQALLAAGADVDAPNFYIDENKVTLAHTALHMMVARGEIGHVRRLIDAGADVNRQTTDGATPLALAAADDAVAIVRALLDAGADTKIGDFFGRTPVSRSGPQTRALLSGQYSS